MDKYVFIIWFFILLIGMIYIFGWRLFLFIKLRSFYVYEWKSNYDVDQTNRRVKINLHTKKVTRYKGINSKFIFLVDNSYTTELEYYSFKKKYFDF